MASFTSTIEEFSDKENHRTFAVDGHTVVKPKLVIQRRSQPKTPQSPSESSLSVVYGTLDADGSPIPTKVNISASVRYAAHSDPTDVTAALAVFRDLVASDEFTNMVTSQRYIQ